jgi:hypothetical protein
MLGFGDLLQLGTNQDPKALFIAKTGELSQGRIFLLIISLKYCVLQ